MRDIVSGSPSPRISQTLMSTGGIRKAIADCPLELTRGLCGEDDASIPRHEVDDPGRWAIKGMCLQGKGAKW